MKIRAVFISAILLSNPAWTAELTQASKAEIEHLFAFIKSSSCEFKRNNTWHKATDAADHIRTKYEYLIKRDLVSSAEQFIERAASKSSMSGTQYVVRCGSATEITSSTWLNSELSAYRAGSGK